MTFAQNLQSPLPPTAPAVGRSLAAPKAPRGPGLVVTENSAVRLHVGDRFIARKTECPDEYLYCEVQEKSESGVAICIVINGGWSLRFSRKGRATYRDNHVAVICMLLPPHLRGVRNMSNYDQVLDAAEKQLRRAQKLPLG